MSLAEKVRKAEPRVVLRGRCNVQKALEQLTQDDADALVEVIYNRRDLTGAEVADLLDEEGLDIGPDTVRRHRLGRCRTCNPKE